MAETAIDSRSDPPRAQVIDAHQHFLFPSRTPYPWMQDAALTPLRRDFTPQDLRPLLRANGVDKTVLVQTRSSLEETRQFLRIAAETDYVAGVVGWVDLCDSAVDNVLEELLAAETGRYLVGLRHQVHDEASPHWLLQDPVQQAIAELGKRDLSYDFLARVRELPACVQTARNHPQVRFVLDHLAKPDIRRGQWDEWLAALAPLAALPNVWVKLSGLVTEADWQHWQPQDLQPYLAKALELFGSRRCLFGSDWPICELAADYSQVKATLTGLPSEIFSNALEVYKLQLQPPVSGPSY